MTDISDPLLRIERRLEELADRLAADAPLFPQDLVGSRPGLVDHVRPFLWPGNAWTEQLGPVLTNNHAGYFMARWRCLDANRLELVFELDGQLRSRPFVFTLAP